MENAGLDAFASRRAVGCDTANIFMFAWPWMEQLLPGMPEWAGWLGIAAAIVAGLGLALVLALMIAPVTALVAGIFLDDVADVVEREDYPGEPAGTPCRLDAL